MKIVLGSDHGGVELKDALVTYLQEKGHEVQDLGTHGTESVDYPDYAKKVAAVVLEESIPGILVCGTGIGISIAANKVPGIRAALCSEEFSARMSRRHNNANILCLGGRTTGVELAKSIVDAYLEEDFEGGRHQRRVDLIEETNK